MEKFPSPLDRIITARLYVSGLNWQAGHKSANVILTPAYANGANASWATASPSGKFEMNVQNPAALEFFEEAMKLGSFDCIGVEFKIVKSELPATE